VILDLRPGSAAHGKHVAVTLRANDGRMLFIPAGVHHGFLTSRTTPRCFYQMSEFYEPIAASACAGTIRRSRSSGPRRCA
jgi:dTDP-4-dehydrorhamnose 3,5-epimerase